MLSQLIIGGDPASRLEALAPYLQSFQVALDGSQQSLKIEAVRELQHALSFAPTTRQTQYHLIIEAQNLTLPAQHALLKTLEEPPLNVQIFLTADKKSSLLPTILSRVQVTSLATLKGAISNQDEINQLFKLLASSQISPLVALATTLAKSDPKTFIFSLIDKLRSSLSTHPNLNRATALKLSRIALSDLQTNINKELILSHLFLNLHSLTHHN